MNINEIADASTSACCDAPVRVENGEPDFFGHYDGRVTTCWFVCTACGRSCDARRKGAA